MELDIAKLSNGVAKYSGQYEVQKLHQKPTSYIQYKTL